MRVRKSVRSKALKQHQLGPLLGGVKDLSQHTAIYISGINLLMIAVTAYHTTLREYIQDVFPWFTFGTFLGILLTIILVMMVIEYKYILPSTWAFRNIQQYKHEYPIKEDVKMLAEKIDRVEKMMEKILNGKGKEKDAD